MITVSSVAHGFLTNVINDVISEDTGDAHLFKEKDKVRDVKERALEKLQEVSESILTQDYVHSGRTVSELLMPQIGFSVPVTNLDSQNYNIN
jgi:hypothetical protein